MAFVLKFQKTVVMNYLSQTIGNTSTTKQQHLLGNTLNN